MSSIRFAPRTIANARRVRSRLMARLLRNLRRRAVASIVATCAAVARAWRDQEELAEMLRFDDRLLQDIGVSRGEILAAVKERRWTRAAWRLVTAALARHDDGHAHGKAGMAMQVSFRASPMSRPRKRHARSAVRRLAA